VLIRRPKKNDLTRVRPFIERSYVCRSTSYKYGLGIEKVKAIRISVRWERERSGLSQHNLLNLLFNAIMKGAFVTLNLRSPEEIALLLHFTPDELKDLSPGEIRLLAALSHEDLPEVMPTEAARKVQQRYGGRVLERITSVLLRARASYVRQSTDKQQARGAVAHRREKKRPKLPQQETPHRCRRRSIQV